MKKLSKSKRTANRICAYCGNPFYARPSSIKKGGGIYCSMECLHLDGTIEFVCTVCGKSFRVWKSHVEHAKALGSSVKYCSKECQNKGMRSDEKICPICGNSFYKRHHMKTQIYCSNSCSAKAREKRVERECETCGKKIFVKLAVINEGNGRYCSKECANKGLMVDKIEKICPGCGNFFLFFLQGRTESFVLIPVHRHLIGNIMRR